MRFGLDQSDLHIGDSRYDVGESNAGLNRIGKTFSGSRGNSNCDTAAAVTATCHDRFDGRDTLESLVGREGGIILHGVHLSQR